MPSHTRETGSCGKMSLTKLRAGSKLPELTMGDNSKPMPTRARKEPPRAATSSNIPNENWPALCVVYLMGTIGRRPLLFSQHAVYVRKQFTRKGWFLWPRRSEDGDSVCL